jgi:hypothetical protein
MSLSLFPNEINTFLTQTKRKKILNTQNILRAYFDPLLALKFAAKETKIPFLIFLFCLIHFYIFFVHFVSVYCTRYRYFFCRSARFYFFMFCFSMSSSVYTCDFFSFFSLGCFRFVLTFFSPYP